jgi:hypothetical protein
VYEIVDGGKSIITSYTEGVDNPSKLIEHAAYYNLFQENEFYGFLANIFFGWYMFDFDYDLNPEKIQELRGAIIKCFDPQLKCLNFIKNSTQSQKHPEDFYTYCNNLIKNIDVEEVFKKYEIGHFNDIPED